MSGVDPITLIVGEETQITVKAFSQDGELIQVGTAWESGDSELVSVDQSGLITGNEKTTGDGVEIVLTIVGRGIEIKFNVEVLGGVPATVAIATEDGNKGPFTLAVGGSAIELLATVNDGSKPVAIDITKVVEVTWASSNPAVVSVDDGEVMAVAPGRASVVAMSGGKTSNAVHFTVTDVAEPNLRVRALFVEADDRTITVPVEDGELNTTTVQAKTVSMIAEVQKKNADGTWERDVEANDPVMARSQNNDIIDLSANAAAINNGLIDLTINPDDLKSIGSASIVLSYPRAISAAVVITVKAAAAE